MGIVISAFPGKGKSYATKHFKRWKISDSDSSKFSWIYENGIKTDKRNPNFIDDYMAHIKQAIETNDVVFVSSHSDVRKALEREKIIYILVYGYYTEKDEYLQLYKDRGNSDKFITSMAENYTSYIEEMDKEDWPMKIKLHYNEFLTEDIIEYLIETKGLSFINKSDPEHCNWTMEEQFGSVSPSIMSKYKDLLDIDTLYMYRKVPEHIARMLPLNVDYMLKYQNYTGGFKKYLINKQKRSK